MSVGACIKNASLTYREKPIFSHLSLSVPAGKWIAILGPKETGKTAFLRMIAGQTTADETIFYQQTSDNNQPLHELTCLLTQNDQLRPWLSILDNTLISLEFNEFSADDIRDKTEQAKSLLDENGLYDFKDAYPYELNHFMRQRLALIRTVIEDKPIILLDEPFVQFNTDDRSALNDLAANFFCHKSVVFVTREPDDAIRYAHEVLLMHGQPVRLSAIASLASPTPRNLSDPLLNAIHSTLFQQLALV